MIKLELNSLEFIRKQIKVMKEVLKDQSVMLEKNQEKINKLIKEKGIDV